MASYKYPIDFMTSPDRKPKNRVYDLEAISSDPLAAMKAATRSKIFASTKNNVKERLVEVIAVDNDIKMPADHNFGYKEILESYGTRSYICVIGRIQDLDAGIPDPDSIVELSTGNLTIPFKDGTRIRNHVGKFYASVEDLKGKMIGAIQVGDILLVEFQDKNTMSNGIIKEVYLKKDTNSYVKATVVVRRSGGGGGGGGSDTVDDSGGSGLDPGGPIIGEGLFIGGSMSKPIGSAACKKAGFSSRIATTNLQVSGATIGDLINGGMVYGNPLLGLKNANPANYEGIDQDHIVINVGGNDGFQGGRGKVAPLHAELVRVFPKAKHFWIMKSPNHGTNSSRTGTEITNYYLTSYKGFNPPFRILNTLILKPAHESDKINEAHAGNPKTWYWPETQKLADHCAEVLQGTISAADYTQV